MVYEDGSMRGFNRWVEDFETFVMKKGKVPPYKNRPYGFKAPKHNWANVEDGIQYFRMMAGKAPEGSSPKIQEELNLNKVQHGRL